MSALCPVFVSASRVRYFLIFPVVFTPYLFRPCERDPYCRPYAKPVLDSYNSFGEYQFQSAAISSRVAIPVTNSFLTVTAEAVLAKSATSLNGQSAAMVQASADMNVSPAPQMSIGGRTRRPGTLTVFPFSHTMQP